MSVTLQPVGIPFTELKQIIVKSLREIIDPRHFKIDVDDNSELTIGSASTNNIVLNASFAPQCCVFRRNNEVVIVECLNGNKVTVYGVEKETINDKKQLCNGDEIIIGNSESHGNDVVHLKIDGIGWEAGYGSMSGYPLRPLGIF